MIRNVHEAEHGIQSAVNVKILPVDAPGVFPAALVEALDCLVNLELRVYRRAGVVFLVKERVVLSVVFKYEAARGLIEIFPSPAPGVPVVSALVVCYRGFAVSVGGFTGHNDPGYFLTYCCGLCGLCALSLSRSRAGSRNAFLRGIPGATCEQQERRRHQ